MSWSCRKNDSAPRFSLSLHDLRSSMGNEAVKIIDRVIEEFQCPVTFHIVFDEIPVEGSALLECLRKLIAGGSAEVVFHGLSHACPRRGHRLLSWYHKYQAEYLEDSGDLRSRSGEVFEKLKAILGSNLGICPPCWIAHEKNLKFFRDLHPLYLESLLFVKRGTRRYFSPVISLGSPERLELFFLRLLGRVMYRAARLMRTYGVRVAVHTCDITVPPSMDFFHLMVSRLRKSGHVPVLMRDLQDEAEH